MSISSLFLEIAGPVLAVIGIVLMVVKAVLDSLHPKHPLDDFMRNVGIPFVDALKLPKSNVQRLEIELVPST